MKLYNLVFWYDTVMEPFSVHLVWDSALSYDYLVRYITDYLKEELDNETIYEDKISIVSCDLVVLDDYKIKLIKR